MKELTAAEETTIAALVKKAASQDRTSSGW
jgi:hypothetical protein